MTFEPLDEVWRNELSRKNVYGNVVQTAGLLARFPVALLARMEEIQHELSSLGTAGDEG